MDINKSSIAIYEFFHFPMTRWNFGKVQSRLDDGVVAHTYEGSPYCVGTFDWCEMASGNTEPQAGDVIQVDESITLRVLAVNEHEELALMVVVND